MKPATHKRVSAYVRRCADAMFLSDWEIAVAAKFVVQPDNEDVFADVFRNDPYPEAVVSISESILKKSPVFRRKIIAHELCHLLLADISHALERSADGLADRLVAHYVDIEERAVTRLSRIIAPTLPLPGKWV